MVNIVELCPPFKLSGLSSFKITFNYDPSLVEAVKSVPGAVWHKTQKFWECPASSLSELLDTLTMISDVELRLASDTAETSAISEPLTEPEVAALKVKLFQHQIEAINYGLAKPKWLLTHGMGCGKTVSAMSLAETLHKRGKIEHCLIVCAVASLRQNWKKEILKYSNETCMVLGEHITRTGTITYTTVKERVAQLMSPINEFFIITNIESLRDDSVIKAISSGPNNIDMIVVDEIHRTNNKQSQQGNNLLKLKSQYKVGMSGTLLVNKPLDLYLPLVWTENDRSTLTNFKSQYCTFGGFSGKQIVGFKNLDLLKEELDSCSLRRTLNDVVDMPMRNVETELLEMNPDHAKFYEDIKAGVKDGALKVKLNSSNLLALMTRLRQATVDPSILTTESVSSTKIDRCIELINDLVEQREKVVVFSNFKQPLENLATKLAEFRPLVCTGDYSDYDVSQKVDKFQADPDALIMLCTHARMGTGFSLNAAAYAIMLDTPYTYSSLDQSICRIYRLNNTRPCYVKILACKNTVDERVAEIVETKRDLGDFVMDGKMSSSLQAELLNIINTL